ncbi:MAG: hypothetical protein K2H45_04800 [Acetatifactor sp.]|nr:hypothetical protein [Acetatifactor sp.]
MDNLFEQVSDYLSNSYLNEEIMNNEAYLQADAEVDKLHEKLRGIDISKETKEVIDEWIDSYINLMMINVELAYQQGMKDLTDFIVSLMKFNIDK